MNNLRNRLWKAISLLSFLMALAACGGGSGSGSSEGDNANVSSLAISAGTLMPVFSADELTYDVSVEADTTEITILAVAQDSAIDSLTIDSQTLNSGDTSSPIALDPGDNAIAVIVIAEDGETTRTYTINVNRQPVVNNHSSQRVVFIADSDTDRVFELYSVLDDGVATPVKISGALVESGDVKSFQISPDRTHVAYLADQDTDRTVELYVVPIDGSASAIRVSPPAATSVTSIKSVSWSHDSSALVFLGDIGTRGADELYMVESDGANPRIINGSIGGSVEIGDYAWSPDSGFVAYEVYNRDKPWEVIGINSHRTGATSTIDPGFSIRISDTLSPPRSIKSFAWSANSTSVAYLADQDLVNSNELYISTAGITASDTKLSHDGASEISDYALSPDGLTVAYVSPFDSAKQLYTSAIDASVRGTLLSQTAVVVSRLAWSPDSSTLAYLARPESQSDMTIDELFWSAADASSIATILSSESAIADSGVKRFQWSPDGSSIGYLADHEENDRFELYLSLLDGSSLASKRSGVLAEGGDVEAFAWSPDGEMLAFRAESDIEGTSALFTSLADGSRIATRVSQSNSEESDDRGVFTFDWADDSEALTYQGNDRDGGVRELYTGLANGHIKGYLVAGDNIRPEYAYNAGFMARETYHDEITSLFRDGSWSSQDGSDFCGMAYHEETDAMFFSRCDSRGDHTILRYAFETSVLDEVYRYASQNDYGMRIVEDDLFILRTYDQSILHLSGLDQPTLTRVDDYLDGVNLAGMEEKYDIAVFDGDFYLVAGNALGSAQHNGIHFLVEPDYDVLTELVSDVSADWPNEPFSYARAIIHINNGLENHLVVATGNEGNLERWTIDGVFANEVAGFGASYLQVDSNSRVYAVSTNTINSSVTRWTSDLSNQEIFSFESTLNSGFNLRFALRETASEVEIYMGSFRTRDLRIDMTAVPQ